jgi:N-acetylmuramoyl-L-alanine amidase
MKLWLDGGHGGIDSGAVGFGLKEKDLTLTLVKKIGKLLEDYREVDVRYSRIDDRFLELKERANKANQAGADFFCSVHINATPTGTGFETFIYNEASSQSVAYQNVIHPEIMKQLGDVKDRGKKRANYAVLRETHMPSILTENLFIDNPNDNKKLKQNEYLDKIALGHVNGFEKAFGLKKREVVVIPPKPKVIYRVVTASFANYENADRYVKLLDGKGIKSFIDTVKQ